jgi:hypothetical protein
MTTRFWCALILGLWCGVAGTASAQQWAKDMFKKKTSHDFGTLARGAKAQFGFKFENLYLEDVRVQNVHTSCGCAGIKYPTKDIKTYGTGEIIVTVDTRSFLGRKDATLTVVFDKPFHAEVPLQIHSYIRSDIVFQPGEVQFGAIEQGKPTKRKVTINYAGRDDWRIKSIRSPQPYIETELKETRRGFGRVAYELWVSLKAETPVGYLSDQLVLETNDTNPQKAKVPLAIAGVVKSDLTVRPATLTFLATASGKEMKRNVVVQGMRPFHVTEVTCDDPRIRCRAPETAGKVQLIPIVFSPGDKQGKSDTEIRITTDQGKQRVLKVSVHTEVAASSEGS